MAVTEHFGLTMPAQDDLYDVDVYNANLQAVDAQAVRGITIATICALPQSTYDALPEKDAETVYLIY